MINNYVIRASHLKYKYPFATNYSLNDVSFDVQSGEWLSIIGHNGSGKSTLISALDGLITIDSGTIEVASIQLSVDTVWEIRKHLGIVFQNPDDQFVGATVEDDVAFGLQNQGIPSQVMHQIVEQALADVEMTAFKTKAPNDLSGGQKQRVALAGIIALHPQVIILDEATNMLDPMGKQQVLNGLRTLQQRYHITIISITHDVNELKLADRILVLKAGRVVFEDRPQVIFNHPQQLISMGLELPYVDQLQMQLKRAGVVTPGNHMSEGAFIEWIKQFHLKK